MLWILLSTVLALENSTFIYESYSNACRKMQICYENIPIPISQPLLQLSIQVSLTDIDGNLSEYPTPKPIVYIRFDSIPDEEYYDYKFELKEKDDWKYKINIPYPKKANYFIFRLDGGLLDQSHMQAAYTVYGWRYKIKVWSYFCESQFFTSSLNLEDYSNITAECDTEVFDLPKSAVSSAIKPVIHEIRPGTEFLILKVHGSISNLNLTASSDNFIFVDTVNQSNFFHFNESGEIIISSPKPSLWYFVFFSSEDQAFEYEIITKDYKWDKEGHMIVNNMMVFQDSVSSHTSIASNEIPMNLYGNISSEFPIHYYKFIVLPDHVDNRYGAKLMIDNNSTTDENRIYNILNENLEIRIQLGSPPTATSSYFYFISCKDSNVYCSITKESEKIAIIIEFRYLKQGVNYISLEFKSNDTKNISIPFSLGIFRTKVGNNMCNSQYNYLSNQVAYTCYCSQNTAGPYCGELAFSDSIYDIGLIFLVASNLAMIPALIVGTLHFYYGEVTVYGLNMITSMMYHACDWEYYCFGFSSGSIRIVDFLISFMSILVCFIHIARLKNPNIKTAIYVFLFVLMIYVDLNTAFDGTLFTFSPPIFAGMIMICRYVYIIVTLSKKEENKLWSWKQVKWLFFISKLINIKWAIAAAISFLLALSSRFFEINSNYFITHSFWHIFIMLTPLFVFLIFPLNQAHFIFEKKAVSEFTELKDYISIKSTNTVNI